MRVYVYYNLHKELLSVKLIDKAYKGTKLFNKVIYHAHKLILTECEFKVSLAGRNRVLRDKQKNVHAGIVGTLEWGGDVKARYFCAELIANILSYKVLAKLWKARLGEEEGIRITYDPYKYDSFVIKGTEKPISGIDIVAIHDKMILGYKE